MDEQTQELILTLIESSWSLTQHFSVKKAAQEDSFIREDIQRIQKTIDELQPKLKQSNKPIED